MKIRISDLPNEGLAFSESISLAALNNRMNEAPNNDIEFTTTPKFECFVTPKKGGAELQGTVTSSFKQPCVRCLEIFAKDIEVPLSVFLRQVAARDRITDSDEEGILYFEGEHADLENLIQESLILALDPFNHKHEACELFSYQKEVDKPINTFAALLKKAGV